MRRWIIAGILFMYNLSLSSAVLAKDLIVLPEGNYQPGVYHFEPITVPKETQQLTVTAKREQWPDTGEDVVSIKIDYSNDGGKTWKNLFGFNSMGGQMVDRKTGIVQVQSWVEFNVPDLGSSDRQIRGRLETYTALTTELKIGIP